MRLKPKTTTLAPRALVYKRFTNIEQSIVNTTQYQTTVDNKFWVFDYENLQFIQVQPSTSQSQTVILVQNNTTVFQYKDKYFRYNNGWVDSTSGSGAGISPLSLKFGNIGKYQTNRYYFTGSFTYVMKTDEESTTVQYVKGNITPLVTMSIKYFDDNINLSTDDLVVIEGHLYSVENPEKIHKHMPKEFNVYYATLNSIL